MPDYQVLIADDHPLFRTALRQAVVQTLGQTAIAETDSFEGVRTLVEQHPGVELVFLDLYMPGNDGFTGLTLLHNHYPDISVVMVSSDDRPDVVRKALHFGAAAFIPKSATLETIATAVRAVLDGEHWLPCSPEPVAEEDVDSRRLAAQLKQLTPQQFRVLEMVSDGRLNKQIAYDLKIQETTVKQHVSAILAKLEVNNRTQAGVAFQQLKMTPVE